ncbi:MAG: hypothetical protein COA33_013355 [Fluviicola sp.]|nr:hypothetical protein [Fluviicola sp.]
MILLIAVAVLGALLSFLKIQKLGVSTFVLLLVSGFISTFYVLKIGKKNMRELPLIKIHLIAFTWVAVLIVFPLLNEEILLATLYIALAHYAYVVAVTIPFDIRDLIYDAPSQKTIPQLLGIKGSKVLAIALLLLFFSSMTNLRPELLLNPLFYIAVATQIVLVLFMNKNRGDFYCAGLIDGAIALLGVSYFC